MIPGWLKRSYYACMAVPMFVSGVVYRNFRAPKSRSSETVKVHLGPGQEGYKPGWINVDANIITARIDVWADLRNKLPFRDESVDVFYSHHVIEHLPDSFLPLHFRDLYRCLKKGGVIRIGGPNGDEAMRNFVEGNASWFPDFPDRRESLGGKLGNFILCRGEHLTILTRSYLQELLSAAGFMDIEFCRPVSETRYPEFLNDALSSEWEKTPASPHTLMVEATKRF